MKCVININNNFYFFLKMFKKLACVTMASFSTPYLTFEGSAFRRYNFQFVGSSISTFS